MKDVTIIQNLRAVEESCVNRYVDNRNLVTHVSLHIRSIEKILTSKLLLAKFILLVLISPSRARKMIIDIHVAMLEESHKEKEKMNAQHQAGVSTKEADGIGGR